MASPINSHLHIISREESIRDYGFKGDGREILIKSKTPLDERVLSTVVGALQQFIFNKDVKRFNKICKTHEVTLTLR